MLQRATVSPQPLQSSEASNKHRGIVAIPVMMQFLIGLLLTSFLRISVQTKTNQQIERTHVLKGSIQHLSSRMDISKQSRMSDDYVHEVIFVIKQKNMEELTRFLHDVSDPQSANYGQHMTGTAVSHLTYNSQGRESLLEYLHSTGATVVTETLGGEYITASAPIPVWERMFSCEFFMFHQTQKNEITKRVVRTESYSIPVCLDNHVESVFGTVELPRENLSTLRSAMIDPDNEKFDLQATDYISPTKLRAAYNMGTSTGSDSSTQAVYASLDQYFSPSDLSQFQTSFGINQQAVSTSIGDHESYSACINGTNCFGNLITQYIIAASPISPTTYLYTDMSTFSDWLVLVANTQKPALVLIIAYGIDEAGVSYAERDAFNTQAIKLGVMGVTIVVASGDNGAVSARGLDRCYYAPTFPASSPYVTAVGATLVSLRVWYDMICENQVN